MSGQQPQYGQPPYGQQPPNMPPGPPPGPQYGQQPQGMPPGPPPGQQYGPGWQQPPEQPRSKPRKSSRSGLVVITIVLLTCLVVALGVICGYLLFTNTTESSAGTTKASTSSVELPSKLGDFAEQDDSGTSKDYRVDLAETRANFEELIGAGFDTKVYERADKKDSDTQTVTVQAIRAELPLTPTSTTGLTSTEIVRDNLMCTLTYYEGVDAEGNTVSGDEKEQLPQACTLSTDGMTIYVNTYSTSASPDPPSITEMTQIADTAYDAAK